MYIHLVSHLTVPVPWFCFRELEGSLSSSLEHSKAPKVPKHNPSRRQSNSAIKDRVLKRRKEKPVEGGTGRGEGLILAGKKENVTGVPSIVLVVLLFLLLVSLFIFALFS